MELWRGGDARNDIESTEFPDRAIGRELGLAPGWREELRRGDPTCPNTEALEAAARSSSAFSC